MAIVQNPIIGSSKGQSGGMVFSTVLGKNVMRSRPFSYRDAKTPQQQAQRSKIIFSNKLANVFKPYFFDFGIKKEAVKLNKYPSNLVVSYGLRTELNVDNVPIYNNNGLVFGSDDISSWFIDSVNRQSASIFDIELRFDKIYSTDNKKDKLSVLVVNLDDYTSQIFVDIGVRNDCNPSFETNLSLTYDSNVAIFVCFRSSDYLRCSKWNCVHQES